MTTLNTLLNTFFLRAILTGLSLVLISSSCTYTYIPPIPRGRVEPDPSLDLHASFGIQQTAQGLTLLLTAQDVPEADWLAVQWFAPDNSQVASASQWLTPNRNPQDLRFRLPADVAVTDGDWRAVVSFQNRVARQFSLPVGELGLEVDGAPDIPTANTPIPEDDIPAGLQPEQPNINTPDENTQDGSSQHGASQDDTTSSEDIGDGSEDGDDSDTQNDQGLEDGEDTEGAAQPQNTPANNGVTNEETTSPEAVGEPSAPDSP